LMTRTRALESICSDRRSVTNATEAHEVPRTKRSASKLVEQGCETTKRAESLDFNYLKTFLR
ncbi:hypothetical protein, partial [Leptospira borgpetersenii]|uniref:hypothetical protein n=1 Tax=Leptospira borgpetersenii TaxID=174 RepID=UPI001F22ED33